MAKSIEIDRKKRLRDEPNKGHNRWHPDIAPVIEAAPGVEVTLETRDANDLQIHAGTSAKDLEKLERTVAHPLTGPGCVEGRSRAICWRSSAWTSCRSAMGGRA
jgi:formamidase